MSEERQRDATAPLGDLLERLAHDLRGPLSAVITNLQFASMQVRDPQVVEALEESSAAAERIAGALEDMAQLSALQDGSARRATRELELSELGARVFRQLAPQLGSRSLEIALPDGVVRTDGGLLERILINIADHALRRTPWRGAVQLRGRIEEDRVELQIIDGGPPFDPEHTPSLLALRPPRGHDGGQGFRSDRGLGLYFAGVAARALGAQLAVRAREDGSPGVTFELRLPRVDPDPN